MTTALRTAMMHQAEWGIAHTAEIHYAQDRPIPLDRYKAHKLPITTDCSGWVTCLAFAAGVKPDPNHQEYNGQGFTGTLLDHLEHIDRKEAQMGDFVAFGPYPGEHVVMLLEAGTRPDPLVASHGQEAGPIKLPLSQEDAAHAAPTVFLRSIPVVSTIVVWDIRNGRNELIAKGIKHPARYAIRHPKMFRRFGQIKYHSRTIPK